MTVSGDVSRPYRPDKQQQQLTKQIKNLDANAERGFHVQ